MSLHNARVAILEARMSEEMANLLRRYGGEPVSVPAVREVALDCKPQVASFIDHLASSALHAVVFFTGVGVTTLMREAEQLGRLQELLEALRKVPVICRGPKPFAALKRYDVPVAASAREPYTSHELLATLATFPLEDATVGVVHYGERNNFIAQELTSRGAIVLELCLYEWLLPEDTSRLETLAHEIVDRRITAVVFTSQIQARHLFLIAEKMGMAQDLAAALQTKTIVASIGPTCTGVLQGYGITPHVMPEHPKMGHLMRALAEYMSH